MVKNCPEGDGPKLVGTAFVLWIHPHENPPGKHRDVINGSGFDLHLHAQPFQASGIDDVGVASIGGNLAIGKGILLIVIEDIDPNPY
jgi:hypothetical protein